MFIREHKQQHQTVFDVCERTSDGSVNVVRRLLVHYACTTNSAGETRHIIYDEQMRPITSLYQFLNVKCKMLNPSTITRMVTPLRLLVAFCEAHHFKDFYIPEEYCLDFVDFLYRNEKTLGTSAAIYFADIKAFLRYIKRDNDPIMSKKHRMTWLMGADGVERPSSYDEYQYAPKRNPERDLVCPAHNTVEDFSKIQKTMMRKSFRSGIIGDIVGCLIILLLFKYGRRIGEVLGLTIEDISTVVSTSTGEISHCIILRNRVHDKVGHRAKRRIRPLSKEYYANREYIKAYNSPRNCVKLEESDYQAIKVFIDVIHKQAKEEWPEQYATAVADIVNAKCFALDWELDENHYLFLNVKGGLLTKAAWYKRIRQYYVDADIPLGYGKSPNHAWRHGIAVIMRHELHMTSREIADFLGQKRASSADVYAKADNDMMAKFSETVYQYLDQKIKTLEGLMNDGR